MAELVKTLSRTYAAMLGRNAIDGTGLTGAFDFRLTWAMDSAGARTGAIDTTPADLAGPSIFTCFTRTTWAKA